MATQTGHGRETIETDSDHVDPDGSGMETAEHGRFERFSGVQVYVHATMALSIFLLYLTGLPMTFNEQIGWLFSVFTYGNVVLLHVLFGLVLIGVGLFYLVYLLIGMAIERRPLPSIPRLRDLRESIAYVGYLLGRNEKPPAAKYNWLQKAEVWVLAVELVVLSASGLLLWYRGLFVAPEIQALLGPELAGVAYLIVRDIHVVVALTMLMGISFHLYMVNVKERFPFNETMFSGTVSAERAAHHWKDWATAKANGEELPEGHTPSPSKETLVGVTFVLLVFFAVVLTATLFASVLSPLPSREYLIAMPVDPMAAASAVYFVGLNAAVLLIVAAGIAIVYGITKRLRGAYDGGA